MNETRHSTTIESFRYHYRVTGQVGSLPPVFFLSGAFQSMSSWSRFERIFREITSVIVADLPGCGEADALPPGYGLDFLSEAVLKILDEQEIDRVYLVASSYGSPIAYRLAQRHPDRVSHLVLAGTMREIPEHRRASVSDSMESLERGDIDGFIEEVLDGLLNRNEPGVERRRVAERILSSSLRQMGDRDVLHYRWNSQRLLEHEPLDLEQPPAVETLVFTGEFDTFTTPEACREIADAVGARFTTIRGADHLFHVEQFATTVDLLLRFVQHRLPDALPGSHAIEDRRARKRSA